MVKTDALCPHCSGAIRIPLTAIGFEAECPFCSGVMNIQEDSSPSPAAYNQTLRNPKDNFLMQLLDCMMVVIKAVLDILIWLALLMPKVIGGASRIIGALFRMPWFQFRKLIGEDIIKINYALFTFIQFLYFIVGAGIMLTTFTATGVVSIYMWKWEGAAGSAFGYTLVLLICLGHIVGALIVNLIVRLICEASIVKLKTYHSIANIEDMMKNKS